MFSTKIIYYFFKLLGLLPLQFNFESNLRTYNPAPLFTCSQKDIIYNIFLICLMIVLNYFSIRISYELYYFGNRIKYERIIDTLLTTFGCFSNISVLIIFCIQQKKMVNMFNKILNLLNFLNKINKKVYEQNIKMNGHMIQIIVINLITYSSLVITMDTQNCSSIALFYFATSFSDLILNYAVMEYSLILILLQRYFKVINENLRDISKKSNDLIQIHCIHKTDDVNEEQTQLNVISDTHKIHSSVCEISEELSNLYGKPMFFCTSTSFFILIVYAYYTVKPIVHGKSTLTIVQYIHCHFEIVHYIILLMILAKSVTGVTSEVKY